ncbi:hypothetical protein [Hymenobacter sedentarius]|uniref:hypothetical protein n=1 Tax=Hymenobacter sedentarius TaxID=1411621 RepID=UPI000B2AA3AB|nr:hypothetical protein [Hymenobacter sedentarius]
MQPSANFPYSQQRTQPTSSAAHSVVRALTLTYSVVPIVAGLDKFTNLLTKWEAYLAPGIVKVLPVPAHTFMMIVGVIEVIAGILVFARPRIGAWVVMAWLLCIAATLIIGGHYYDVAVRDVAMAMGAWSLARLSSAPESHS